MEFNDGSFRDGCFAGTPALKVMRLIDSSPPSAQSMAGEHRRVLAFYDACVAFLHAEIDDEIYLIPPLEVCPADKFWRIYKALYGTRRASALWHQFVTKGFLENEFHIAITWGAKRLQPRSPCAQNLGSHLIMSVI